MRVSQLSELLKFELLKSASSSAISTPGSFSDAELYLAEIRDCDARRCEALALASPQRFSALQKMRAFTFRGHLLDAEKMAEELSSESASDEALKQELRIEKARRACFAGDWQLAHLLVDEALNEPHPPTSTLALYQIRALARFELGKMMECAQDLERVDSLTSILPNSISAFYGKILRIKLLARDRAPSVAREALDQLWSSVENLDSDRVSALLRAEVDFRRISGQPLASWAAASMTVASAMGEKLYIGLGLLDCLFSEDHAIRSWAKQAIEPYAKEFEKVRSLILEATGNSDQISTSGIALKSWAETSSQTASVSEPRPDELPAIIVLIPQALVIHLKPWKAVSLKGNDRALSALAVLSDGPVEKAEFFQKIWSLKYRPETHDKLIWDLTYRMRKSWGLPVHIPKSGKTALISLTKTLVCRK